MSGNGEDGNQRSVGRKGRDKEKCLQVNDDGSCLPWQRRGWACYAMRSYFWLSEIKVGVVAGPRIDNGGKVSGKIVGVAPSVKQGKSKGELQRDLGRSDGFAVFPRLAVNRHLAAGRNRVPCHRGQNMRPPLVYQKPTGCISSRRQRLHRFRFSSTPPMRHLPLLDALTK